MRQAGFVVVMVAAAFLGGAVVNGPGVRWIQARLLDYMGLKDGEIASIDLPRTSNDTSQPHPQSIPTNPIGVLTPSPSFVANPSTRSRESASAATLIPSQAKVSPGSSNPPVLPAPRQRQPLLVSAKTSIADSKQPVGRITGGGPGNVGKQIDERPDPKSNDREVGQPLASSADAKPLPEPKAPQPLKISDEATTPSKPTPAPLDPSVGPALLASFAPSSSVPSESPQAKLEAIPLEVAPATPASSQPSVTSGSATRSGQVVIGTTGGITMDWTALRQKLGAVGVTRYTIEGIPGGRVVFSCLIPVAGRQAVSQRFEAEADDEIQAAQAVIRRIALWRVTQSSSEPAH